MFDILTSCVGIETCFLNKVLFHISFFWNKKIFKAIFDFKNYKNDDLFKWLYDEIFQ